MVVIYGCFMGCIGVCFVMFGLGVMNFVMVVVYVQFGGMLMLMIIGQKLIKFSKQGYFQIVDVVDMMQLFMKFMWQIVLIGNILLVVCEVFCCVEEECLGVVYFELFEDIVYEEGDGKLILCSYSWWLVVEEKVVVYVVDVIQVVCYLFLMIGVGGNCKIICKMLFEFVDKMGILFFMMQMGKGVIDEMYLLWFGNVMLFDGDFVYCVIEYVDCIINVGYDVIEKLLFFMCIDDKIVIYVNFFGVQVDFVYFLQIEVVGDIVNVVWQMKEVLML